MKNKDMFSHYREGKAQPQRFLAELNPTYFKLHDFDLADWILFAYNFARQINFFDKDNSSNGNWQVIMDHFGIENITDTEGLENGTIPRRESISYKKLRKNIESDLSAHEKEGSLTPHLTLFTCFIKLLDSTKENFNDLTGRHLDFYYEEILKIEKRAAVPDKAYVIFELAKKAMSERILEGTLLDAKKDADGNKMLYKSTAELIGTQAKIVELKSFLNDSNKKELKVASVANSYDGLGDSLLEDNQYWWPFGYNTNEKNYKNLPDAALGFSIASPLFDLKEGQRTVSISIHYNTNSTGVLQDISVQDLIDNLKIYCSGEKEWLTGPTLGNSTSQISYVDNFKRSTDLLTETTRSLSEIGLSSSLSNLDYANNTSIRNSITTEITDNRLTLTFELPKSFPAVVPYNADVLAQKFETEYPVIRFMLEGNKRYDIYAALAEKEISNIEININVAGVKSIMIENDNGVLNVKKPFLPFTSNPIKKSNFDIKSPEIFAKNWTTANVKINWKDTPNSFIDNYKAYVFNGDQNVTPTAFSSMSNSVINSEYHFKADALIFEEGVWKQKRSNVNLFYETANGHQTNFQITNTNTNVGKCESFRLSLNQSFLQEIFAKIYTLTLAKDNQDKPVPNPAYIPLIESIEIDYSAKGNISNNSSFSTGDSIQFFHEDVFGQYKQVLSPDPITMLLPTHKNGGEFYIGLSAKPGERVSLLVQTLEGSENPKAKNFDDNEKIQWEFLSTNKWFDLKEYILKDETHNFLSSGIIEFKIPAEIDTHNTRLAETLVWVRAKMNKDYDSICKLQGVHAQAVLTVFDDQDEQASHLENDLPAETISKLVTKVPKIKSVNQPYNSFGGISKESNLDYYKRVSERLRHKNKAITQWDYEQLILQEFPEIFKVKCLNHTDENSFMAPGHVSIIVVPNTQNKNAFDVYQPMLSKGLLRKVKDYINTKNSLHVNAVIENPDYQEVEVTIAVKFYKEYDETFYKKQLNEDIKKYISPWAFDVEKEIIFEVNLNKILLIDYLEQLHYVDYIGHLKIKKGADIQQKTLVTANPKSILVSAKDHQVSIATQKG